MNIIVYRYGSICEPDMISTFKATGLNVIEINEEITNKKILSSERIKLIDDQLKNITVTFVFTINFFPEISNLCQLYNIPYLFWTVDSPVMELFNNAIKNSVNRAFLFDKAQFDMISKLTYDNVYHLPLAGAVSRFDDVMLTADSEDCKKFSSDISFVGSLYNEKDVLDSLLKEDTLTKDAAVLSPYVKGYIDAICLSSMNVYGSYILPDNITDDVVIEIKEALKDDFYSPSNMLANTDKYYVTHRLLGYHIANLERSKTISELTKYFSVDLYTRSDVTNLLNTVNDNSKKYDGLSGSLNIHDGVRTLDEMPKIFNLSKINLNMTVRPIETGLPLRCFDILGCGGFLMTNYQDELNDMFQIGVDLEAYTSIDELIDKCDYYLNHDDERKKIAVNGYNKVKDNYTYYHRVLEMIKKMV